MAEKEKILDLYRKTIASLSCIEKIAHDIKIKEEAKCYLDELITSYKMFLEKNNCSSISFNLNEEDIVDFSYRCIENPKNDLVRFGEDVQFGIIELINEIEKIRGL